MILRPLHNQINLESRVLEIIEIQNVLDIQFNSYVMEVCIGKSSGSPSRIRPRSLGYVFVYILCLQHSHALF